jgi:hypothetical protein
MIKYIIPFGYNCYPSIILQELNLRFFSLPFDFIYSNISMIEDCLENNFSDFLDIKNYINYKTKGCINTYYKNKLPHFNMINLEFNSIMRRRINRLYNILKCNDKKLFFMISDGKTDSDETNRLINIINKQTNNYSLLILKRKRGNIDDAVLKYSDEINSVFIYDVTSRQKGVSVDIVKKILEKYNFDLYKKCD